MKKYIFTIIIISNLFSQVDYLTQIQPIFDNNCISCHINGGTYFGGLDLSSHSQVMEGGSSGNIIVPFNHSNSELFSRITLNESDNEFMSQYGTPLSQTEIDLIAQNAKQTSGYKSVQWNAKDNLGQPVSAGVYLYSIETKDFRKTKKMMLLK